MDANRDLLQDQWPEIKGPVRQRWGTLARHRWGTLARHRWGTLARHR